MRPPDEHEDYKESALNNLERAANTGDPGILAYYCAKALVYALFDVSQAMDANTNVQREAAARL